MDFSELFTGGLLVFTVPLLLALLVWLFALVGFFEFSLLDLDLDHDVDTGGLPGWMDVFQALGLGMVPLSLLITVLFFGFGLSGIAATALLGVSLGIAIALALVVGLVLTAGGARVLRPLFTEYGKAQNAHSLVGQVARLTSTQLTPTFGTATLALRSGEVLQLSVRSESGPVDGLRPGHQLLLLEYREAQNVYLVEPFEPNSPPE
ncbi:MAG: hypothetical protein SFY70_07190 [Bacteroidia bacterium]|nr:hypothetical protein [Bacteroidia bacterium]